MRQTNPCATRSGDEVMHTSYLGIIRFEELKVYSIDKSTSRQGSTHHVIAVHTHNFQREMRNKAVKMPDVMALPPLHWRHLDAPASPAAYVVDDHSLATMYAAVEGQLPRAQTYPIFYGRPPVSGFVMCFTLHIPWETGIRRSKSVYTTTDPVWVPGGPASLVHFAGPERLHASDRENSLPKVI
jgi:hypothetical protein